MSKDLHEPRQQSEEVDLGQLFKLFGKAFDRLFKFIRSIFIGVYKVILFFLIHVYRRFNWYAGAIVLGLDLGFIIDMSFDKPYGGNLYIETNFNSARQVYENISQFDQLSYKDKDSTELARRLDISANEASKIERFYIEPDLDENDIAEMYSNFYSRLDSISRLEMSYDLYKESLTPYNFKIHRITVASTDKNIYKRIENSFIEQLAENEYLSDVVEVNKQNLLKEDDALLKQIVKTDSLVDEYLKIRINESQKELIPGGGTNLYMGDAESSNLIVDESKIIEKRLQLEAARRDVNRNLVVQKRAVNVLANFPESGYDMREWYCKMKFAFPLILVILTLLIFGLIGLRNFLETQSKY